MEHYHPTEFSVEGFNQCLELIKEGRYTLYYNQQDEEWIADGMSEVAYDKDFQHAVCRLTIVFHRELRDRGLI